MYRPRPSSSREQAELTRQRGRTGRGSAASGVSSHARSDDSTYVSMEKLAMALAPRASRVTVPPSVDRPRLKAASWQRNSQPTASGKSGALQFVHRRQPCAVRLQHDQVDAHLREHAQDGHQAAGARVVDRRHRRLPASDLVEPFVGEYRITSDAARNETAISLTTVEPAWTRITKPPKSKALGE